MIPTPSFSHDVGVACHFCHARFRVSSLQAATGWACGECEQWNGFSAFTSTGYNVRKLCKCLCMFLRAQRSRVIAAAIDATESLANSKFWHCLAILTNSFRPLFPPSTPEIHPRNARRRGAARTFASSARRSRCRRLVRRHRQSAIDSAVRRVPPRAATAHRFSRRRIGRVGQRLSQRSLRAGLRLQPSFVSIAPVAVAPALARAPARASRRRRVCARPLAGRSARDCGAAALPAVRALRAIGARSPRHHRRAVLAFVRLACVIGIFSVSVGSNVQCASVS